MTIVEEPREIWPDVAPAVPADGRVLLAVGGIAVVTDLAVRSGVMVLAGAVLTALVAAGVLGSGRVANRKAWPVLLAAPLFGLWFAVRTDGVVLALDVVAAAGLLVLGSSLARAGDPLDLTIPNVVGRGLHAMIHGVLAPGFLLGAGRTGAAGGDRARRLALVRGVLLATPVVLAVGLLLGSADPVFASFFRLPTDVGDLVGHVVLAIVGAWGAAALLRLVSAEPFGLASSRRLRVLGDVEATTVLTGLVIVFAAFTLSQVVAAIGGADYVRRTAGLSYAEYARHGFFQLLAVAAITLAVLLALRAGVIDPGARRFVALSEAAVVLTLLLVAGAVRRLSLYEQAYGLTPLRLWSLLFAIWIGAVFVLLGVALARGRRDRSWFVPAAVAVGLVGLLLVNAGNSDA
jgi:hypothetical protein